MSGGAGTVCAPAYLLEGRKKMIKTLIERLGLLGIVSFLSYTAAVVFSPLAYPGFNAALGMHLFLGLTADGGRK